MKRESLLGVLSIVDPALAGNDLIPVLTHYWFTGKEVMAYNDVVAISAPYKTDFKGAIRGSLLGGILSKFAGGDVSFTLEDSSVVIKSGRSKMRVPLLPPDSFLFVFPKVDKDDALLSLDEETKPSLVRAFDICLQSLSRRVSEPQRQGITVVPESKKNLTFYATDSVTLSSAPVTSEGHGLEKHVTMSKLFCESALKLMQRKDIKEVSLHIDDEYAMMLFDDGVKLYGRLVDDPNPPKFKDIVGRYLPKGKGNAMVKIPDGLSAALDRAYLVVHKTLEPVTKIKIAEDAKGKLALRISAKSENGEVVESIAIEDHPEVSLKIDLARFRECDLAKFDRITFDSGCIVLASGRDMYHLVAVQG